MYENYTDCYLETNMAPPEIAEKRSYVDMTDTAVNAIAILTGMSWQDTVKSLVEQAHINATMPSYKTTLNDFLRANGCKKIRFDGTVQELLEACNSKFYEHKKYLIKFGSCFVALVPVDRNRSYYFKGIWPKHYFAMRRLVREVWEYIPGTDNRTGTKRKLKSHELPEESDVLIAKNMNPEGRRIGDCSARALSAAYGCTWHEAIDLLAETSDYTDPDLNECENIRKTLTRIGFKEYSALIKEGNKHVTGREFCKYLNRTYTNGERIFADIGRSHCVAVLPFTDTDGTVTYKIQDTWDSTKGGVGRYWVYTPKDSAH